MKRVALPAARLLGAATSPHLGAPFSFYPGVRKHFSSFTKSLFNSPVEASTVSFSKRARSKSANLNQKQGQNSLGKTTTEGLHTPGSQDDDSVHATTNLENGKGSPFLLQTTSNNDRSPYHRALKEVENRTQPRSMRTTEAMDAHAKGKTVKNTHLKKENKRTVTPSAEIINPHGNSIEDFPDITNYQSEEVQMKMLEKIDHLVIENSDCLTYPLHTFEAIPDSFVNSFRVHRQLVIFRATTEKTAMIKLLSNYEELMATEVLGKSFYFRVDLEPIPPGVPLSDARDSARKRLREEVFGKLKQLLMDFTVNLLEVREGEVVCDVSHYAASAPMIAACKVNVAQFVRDAHCVMTFAPLDLDGVVGETPKEALQPLSVEEVAKEAAARINKEIIQPLLARDAGEGADAALVEDARAVRVFFGIAPTPVLAKIACDAEVSAWRHQHSTPSESIPPTKPTASRGKASTSKVAVRVRSFYSHFRTLEDGKKFMEKFRVAHIPTLTPAFARFLHDVYGIETCGDIYEKRSELHFSLSKESFKECYYAVFGRMRFPEEERTVLFSPTNIISLNYMMKAMATNAISIANPTRTGTRYIMLTSIVNFKKGSDEPFRFKVLRQKIIGSKLMYGRLFTEDQFADAVARAAAKGHELVMKRAITTASIRVVVLRGKMLLHSETRSFPETDDLEVIKEVARSVALDIAPYRQKNGVESSNDANWIQVTLHTLKNKQMIPDRLAADLKTIQTEFFTCVNLLRQFGFWRSGDTNVARTRANSARIMKEFGLKTKEEFEKELVKHDAAAKIVEV